MIEHLFDNKRGHDWTMPSFPDIAEDLMLNLPILICAFVLTVALVRDWFL